MESRELERRVHIFIIIVVAIVSILALRIAYLQIIRGAYFERKAEVNRMRVLPIAAPRGLIYDRTATEENLLVTNRPAFAVSLVPADEPPSNEVLNRLAAVLGMNRLTLDQIIAERRGRSFESIRVALDISPEVHTRLMEMRNELPGVVVEVQPVREYPFGSLAAHVLGYVREISREQLASLERQGSTEYRPGDIYGQMGLENSFDRVIKGKNGGKQLEVDHLGRLISVLGEEDPVPGNSLVLTLDRRLQQVAEKALRDSMLRLRSGHFGKVYPNANTGAVIVQNVKTGEILAMASVPDFDPNIFTGILPFETYQKLVTDPLKPFQNRALASAYPPGSIFKMLTAAAALQEGLVTPQETFYDSGVYWVIPKTCWKKDGHGTVNLVQGIQVSCNIVFYELGRRLGPDKLAEYAAAFGFGKPTGIELAGERAGILPSTIWKKEAFRQGLVREPQWWPAETLDMAIGQGFDTFTPIQLVNYISALANGGKVMWPHLVKEIRSPEGQTLQTFEPRVVSEVPVAAEHLNTVRQGMLAVAEGGTASWVFRNYPIKVGGKTGTAETARGDNHGWFAAFAPFDDPEIAIIVLVEQGGSGSSAGAPVARDILDAYSNINQQQLPALAVGGE